MRNDTRIGKISDVDHSAGLERVVYPDQDDAVT